MSTGRPGTSSGGEDRPALKQISTSYGVITVDSPQGAVREGGSTVLRKRSTTANQSVDLREEPSFGNLRGEAGRAKSSTSILEQIGKPDHLGWLRKKGERYNTWKLRYLVLRGPHLYYLRSDSKAVRFLLKGDCIDAIQ